MADVVLITSSTVNLDNGIHKHVQIERDPAALNMVIVVIRMLIASVRKPEFWKAGFSSLEF